MLALSAVCVTMAAAVLPCPKPPVVAPPRRGFSRLGGDPMPDTMIDPATIEARCRRLMRERAALPDAYPHRDKRADLWALIHAELDEWLEANGHIRFEARP